LIRPCFLKSAVENEHERLWRRQGDRLVQRAGVEEAAVAVAVCEERSEGRHRINLLLAVAPPCGGLVAATAGNALTGGGTRRAPTAKAAGFLERARREEAGRRG